MENRFFKAGKWKMPVFKAGKWKQYPLLSPLRDKHMYQKAKRLERMHLVIDNSLLTHHMHIQNKVFG